MDNTGSQKTRRDYLAQGKDRIIVAVDVESAALAADLVTTLKDEVGAFKIGLELLLSAGPDIMNIVRKAGATRVFCDAKLHDIPNTVASAVKSVCAFSPWLITIHTPGGSEMMKAARAAADQASSALGLERPKLLGVTVLTSIDQNTLSTELGVGEVLSSQVVNLAKLAVASGMDGVIASPQEIELIRKSVPTDFLIITPGVRPAGADIGDQKRVMTPDDAVKRGADYLVIGRPITRADDPVAAARAIASEIDSVLR
jgi:orotidine-5'-phosphate decarboxylase